MDYSNKITVGDVFIDGLDVGNIGNNVIEERNKADEYIKNYKPTAFYEDGQPIYSSEYKNAQKVLADYENKADA